MKKYLFIVLLVGVCFGQITTEKQADDYFRLRSNDAMPSEVLKNLIDIKSIVLSSFDVQKDTVIYSYGKGKNKKLASVRKDVSLHGDEKNFRKIKLAYKSVTNGWHSQKIKYKYDNVGNIVEVNRNFFDQIASKKKVVEYFEYDSNNQLIKRTEYDVDGNILLTSNYEYKNQGDVKEIQIYIQLGDVNILNLEIYKSGRLESISSTSYFLSTKRYYEYNKNGNIKKITHYVINSNGGSWLSMEENFIWKNGLLDKYIKLEPGKALKITNDDKLFPKLEYKFSNYKYYDISKGELNGDIKKGTWVEYNGDEKIEEITYIDGDENYDYVKYNSLGSEVAETGALRNGKPFGQKLVYSDGYIWKKYVYKKGEQILKEEYYLSNSEILSYRKDLFWEENFGYDSEVISKKFIGRFSDFNGYYDGNWFIDSIPNVWAKGNVINGKMNGEWEFYYANKNLLARANYKNGDGRNASKIGVPRDGRNGSFESWYENGKRWERYNYISGKLDGLGESWHENGKRWGRYNYISGKLDGLGESWHENGNPNTKSYYKSGKLIGLYESWHYNGKKKAIEGPYKNGKLNGTSQQWWENGNKKNTFKMINDLKDGSSESWYENGNKRIIYNYKDSKRNGLQEWWHENGQKAGVWQFKSPGIRDESFKIKWWHKNGEKKREGYVKTLKNGKHVWVGKYKAYSDDGTQTHNIKLSKEDGSFISGWYRDKHGDKYRANQKMFPRNLPNLK